MAIVIVGATMGAQVSTANPLGDQASAAERMEAPALPANVTALETALRYAPSLTFDADEHYFPTDPHADDEDVTNNAANYASSPSSFPRVAFWSYNLSRDFVVYQFWFYYAFNEYALGLDNHEHDFESASVWVNWKGEPFHLATSLHLNVKEYSISSVADLSLFVEAGGHGMVRSFRESLCNDLPLSVSFSSPGLTLAPAALSFLPVNGSLQTGAPLDLETGGTLAGTYRTNYPSAIHVFPPWNDARVALGGAVDANASCGLQYGTLSTREGRHLADRLGQRAEPLVPLLGDEPSRSRAAPAKHGDPQQSSLSVPQLEAISGMGLSGVALLAVIVELRGVHSGAARDRPRHLLAAR